MRGRSDETAGTSGARAPSPSSEARSRAPKAASSSREYAAFLSYSRKDEPFALWLHRKLEAYRFPAGVSSVDGQRLLGRLGTIFRDKDELSSSTSLPHQLTEALLAARTLVVVASPRSAASRWVNEEIRQYKLLRPERPINVVVIDGDPYASEHPESGGVEALAEALRHRQGPNGSERQDEINYADLRSEGKSAAFLRVVAGIAGTPLDLLRQRELHRRRKRIVTWTTALGLAATAVGGLFMFREHAHEREIRVEDLARAALTSRDESPPRSLLLAVEAARIQGTPLSPLVEDALRRALEVNTGVASSGDSSLLSLAVRPDAKWAATGSELGTVTLWEVTAADKPRSIVVAHTSEPVSALAFSADGRWLTAGAGDRAYRWTISDDGQAGDPHELPLRTKSVHVLAMNSGKGFVEVGGGFDFGGGAALGARTQVTVRDWDGDRSLSAILPRLAYSQTLSADDRWLAVGHTNGELDICDLATGHAGPSCTAISVCRDEGPNAAVGYFVSSLAFSADGNRLAVGCMNGLVHLMAPLGASERPWVRYGSCRGHKSMVTQLRFSADGDWLASASTDGFVRLWRNGCLEESHALSVLGSTISDLQIRNGPSASGALALMVAASDARGLVHTWLLRARKGSTRYYDLSGADPITRTELDLPGQEAGSLLSFGPHGSILVSASLTGAMRMWQTDYGDPTGRTFALPALDHSEVLLASPDGSWLAIGYGDGGNGFREPMHSLFSGTSFVLWKLRSADNGSSVHRVDAVASSAAFDPQSRWFATASGETIHLWPLGSEESRADGRDLAGGAAVNGIAFAPNGSWLAAGTEAGKILVWRTSDLSLPPLMLTNKGAIKYVAPLGAGHSLLAWTADGCAQLWPVEGEGEHARSEQCGFDLATDHVAISPDGAWLASVSNATPELREIHDGSPWGPPTKLSGHAGNVRGMVATSDRLLTASIDGSILSWRLTSEPQKPTKVLEQAGEVVGLSTSPDGHWLSAATDDGIVRLWNLIAPDPGRSVTVLGSKPHPSVAVAFAGSGLLANLSADPISVMLTGGVDAPMDSPMSASLWVTSADDLLADAQRAASRNLSAAEWARYFPGSSYKPTYTELPVLRALPLEADAGLAASAALPDAGHDSSD